jgi:hypothetical protein
MRATHWLVGCALCIAGIGSAAATSLDTTQDLDPSHAALDSTSPHDGNTGSGGDALGLTRDCPPAGSDGSGSTSGGGSGRSGGASSAPTPTRRPHLGWQSLLPGSIQ